jgi:hypothetical protein
MGVQRDQITYPRSHSSEVSEPGHGLPGLESVFELFVQASS